MSWIPRKWNIRRICHSRLWMTPLRNDRYHQFSLTQGKSELEKVIKKDSDSDSDGIPDYANLASLHQPAIPDHPPPSRPPLGATIICSINTNWAKYHDDDTDVPYYYNASTGESMWQPPFPDRDSEAKNTSACSRQLSGSSVRLNLFACLFMLFNIIVFSPISCHLNFFTIWKHYHNHGSLCIATPGH